MNLYWRIILVFSGILILGWLSLQLSMYDYLGLAGVLLPGLIFGLPFAVANFEGIQNRIKGVVLNSLFASVSIVVAFLLTFSFGPEGAEVEGMKFGFMLGFCGAALLTIMLYTAYGLSWPAALLAIVLGSTLPGLAGFEDAGEASAKPELFGYFWLAVMGAVYSWGLWDKERRYGGMKE
ncbi:MAG: hypothetical protein H6573_01360 [Lewinellaceae bacterium]|nr:hypothetical protein [Phaeodactylibacter sp.]MCB0614199.1 hypothetical protein [Phaeodactylibacter sp.]MCB9346146.1 hypothetical protein [Lewinellaceae bacterium]